MADPGTCDAIASFAGFMADILDVDIDPNKDNIIAGIITTCMYCS